MIFKQCPYHKDEAGNQCLTFEDGDKPIDVIREGVEVVVKRNDAMIAAGGFHEDLIFRASAEGDSFVTLMLNDEGVVEVRPLSKDGLSLIFQQQFCYLVPTTKNPYRHKPMPSEFSKGLVSGKYRLRFPVLRGLLQHPAVHLDGTVVTREGYDPLTKTWIVSGWEDLNIPARPTQAEVVAAVSTLREPFAEVIFKDDKLDGSSPVKKDGVEMTASEANLLSMIISALVRREMDICPFYIITSKQWGTAKGLCTFVISWIVQGHDPASVSVPTSVDQAEKEIGRALIDHPDELMIQIDEPQETGRRSRFYSRQLAMMATLKKMLLRGVYGRKSQLISLQRLMVFTGNSMRPDKDIVRRVCVITLDIPADGTLPHERTFKHKDRANKKLLEYWILGNPEGKTKAQREGQRRRLVEAALVLVRHWAVKGQPKADFDYDFPQWVHIVGGIMQNAGITAWMENRNEVYADADEALRAAFVLSLVESIGSGPISSRELAEQLKAHTDTKEIKDILAAWDDTWADRVYASWGDIEPMSKALARLLGSVKDRLLADGNGGRVTVKSYRGLNNTSQWMFEVPGQKAPSKRPARRPKATP